MKRPPRLTKKPLPATPAGWAREIEGTRKFLIELKQLDPNLLGGWPGKQLSYYSDRMRDLLNNPPKGCRVGK